MRGIKFITILGLMMLVLLTNNINALPDGEKLRIKLGRHTYNIPNHYIVDTNVSFWERLVPGLAPNTEGISLVIPGLDLAVNVNGYVPYDGKLKNDIYLLIDYLNEQGIKEITDPNAHIYSDIWFARGLFNKREVEIHKPTGLYKVSNEGIKHFWTAVRIYPDSSQPIPNDPFSFWVASCVLLGSPLTQTERYTVCRSRLIVEDLQLDFKLSESNLGVIDPVKEYLLKSLNSWRE